MSTHYTATAKALHWIIAVLILGLLGLGFYMQDLPLSPTKLQLYAWHKWAGVTVFLIAVFRLGWRATHRPPALPGHMAPIEQLAAHTAHHLLYALMLVIPLSGWLMSSAKGFQTVWFGVLPLPDLVGKDRALGETLEDVHKILNFALLGLVSLHVAAALKHHFVERGPFLQRMGLGRKEQT